jgi:hypothetical protein
MINIRFGLKFATYYQANGFENEHFALLKLLISNEIRAKSLVFWCIIFIRSHWTQRYMRSSLNFGFKGYLI